MRLRNYVVIMSLLLAAPLSAQQVTTDTLGITVTRDLIILGDTTFVSIGVTVDRAPCDSACIAREEAGIRATQELAEQLAERGPVAVNVVTDFGITAIAWGSSSNKVSKTRSASV